MSDGLAAAAIALAIVALPGVVVPSFAAWLLMRGRGPGPLDVPNYRGRVVSPILGLVWPIWAVALLAVQSMLDMAARLGPAEAGGAGIVGRLVDTPLTLPLYGVPFLLVTGAFAFGLADDAFGRGGPKGFGGHISALRDGRLTTGLVKMVGIGGLALFYGAGAAPGIVERSGVGLPDGASWGVVLAVWLLASAVIALSANLMNLLDLRPGRALKSYVVLAAAPAALFAVRVMASFDAQLAPFAGEIAGLGLTAPESTAVVVGTLLVVLGPVFAVWRYDLGEQAMLGDAGANVMGVIVGYLLTAIMPLWGLAVSALILLALNLASERVSFSGVIERTPPLAWLDRLGRLPDDAWPDAGPSDAGPPAESQDRIPEAASPDGAPDGPPVRYHASGNPTSRED